MKYRGQFPNELKQACTLPGVGDYTARAVLSIAYNQPFPVLDGNVGRVMGRFMARSGSLHEPGFRRRVEENLDGLLSRRRPGDFNQAVMELGQTVCLPRSPHCSSCPLRRWCRAFRFHKPEEYPKPRPRRQAEKWYMATAVLSRNHRILLSRGLDEGLMDDLWNFPSSLGRSSNKALAQLKEKLGAALKASPPLKMPNHQLQHNITYRSIQVEIYTGEFTGRAPGDGFRWFQLGAIEHLAVSQLARKIAGKLVATNEKV